MGLPAPVGVSWIGPPPAGDGANAVDTGSFAAVGASKPVPILGYANATVWAAYKSALTAVANSLAPTVAAIGAIIAGCSINSSLVPPGTTVASINGTTVNLALPTVQLQGVLNSDGTISGLGSTSWLAGAAVSGTNVPAGATVAAIVTPALFPPSGGNAPVTRGVIKLSAAPTTIAPTNVPQTFTFALAAACIAAGVDNNALFTGVPVIFNGTVQLERSFDGASTWLPTTNWNAPGGTPAVFTGNASLPFFEAEAGVFYRLNCVAYSAVSGVTINYRLSATGGASRSLTTGGVI